MKCWNMYLIGVFEKNIGFRDKLILVKFEIFVKLKGNEL